MENIYISQIRRGRITKQQAVETIYNEIKYHAERIVYTSAADSFRYHRTVDHGAELGKYLQYLKETANYNGGE